MRAHTGVCVPHCACTGRACARGVRVAEHAWLLVLRWWSCRVCGGAGVLRPGGFCAREHPGQDVIRGSSPPPRSGLGSILPAQSPPVSYAHHGNIVSVPLVTQTSCRTNRHPGPWRRRAARGAPARLQAARTSAPLSEAAAAFFTVRAQQPQAHRGAVAASHMGHILCQACCRDHDSADESLSPPDESYPTPGPRPAALH